MSKFRKCGENAVILLKIWLEIGTIGVWMVTFFLEQLIYVYGCTFKFCGGTSLPNPNLSTPGIYFVQQLVELWSCSWWYCATCQLDKDKHCHDQLQGQCVGFKCFIVCLFSPRRIFFFFFFFWGKEYQIMCISDSNWHQEKPRYVVTTHHKTFPYENAGKNMCVQMRAAHLFKRATACSTHSHTPSCMQEHAELLVRAVHALSAHSFMRAQFASWKFYACIKMRALHALFARSFMCALFASKILMRAG